MAKLKKLKVILDEVDGIENGFEIMTDMGDAAESALHCWMARTTEFTAESFCKYINSKGLHKAKPVK
jgi:hypothetical protein